MLFVCRKFCYIFSQFDVHLLAQLIFKILVLLSIPIIYSLLWCTALQWYMLAIITGTFFFSLSWLCFHWLYLLANVCISYYVIAMWQLGSCLAFLFAEHILMPLLAHSWLDPFKTPMLCCSVFRVCPAHVSYWRFLSLKYVFLCCIKNLFLPLKLEILDFTPRENFM